MDQGTLDATCRIGCNSIFNLHRSNRLMGLILQEFGPWNRSAARRGPIRIFQMQEMFGCLDCCLPSASFGVAGFGDVKSKGGLGN